MQSVRCFGETKFFRQCPRYVTTSLLNDQHCFCWEHSEQTQVRLHEINIQEEMGKRPDWAPLGAFLSNLDDDDFLLSKISPIETRLKELADDDQNVHTAEVQVGVSNAIKRLKEWAVDVKVEKDLAHTIEQVLEDSSSVVNALDHLRHCYQWNDETQMFGVTYPQLASWVWARVTRENENRELLMERFFEEVEESSGQCLNGNMARLMNVFSAIDIEMSPQQIGLTREQVQNLISNCVDKSATVEDAIKETKSILFQGNIPKCEWESWINAIQELF